MTTEAPGTPATPESKATSASQQPSAPPPQPAASATPPPSVPPTEPATSGGSNRLMYWIIAGVVAVLVVIGLVAYNSAKTDKEAQQKAQQLTQSFQQAGLPVPSDLENITRSLGTDGGAVCDNPANALGKATLNDLMTNGADFVGRRPVIIDRQILRGEALILQTYCPDKLPKFLQKINDLKSADTVD
jgi:hypothetical protein